MVVVSQKVDGKSTVPTGSGTQNQCCVKHNIDHQLIDELCTKQTKRIDYRFSDHAIFMGELFYIFFYIGGSEWRIYVKYADRLDLKKDNLEKDKVLFSCS